MAGGKNFSCFPTTSYSHQSKMRSDQPHPRQRKGPGQPGLSLAEKIKELVMRKICIIFMHSQARATAFFAWGQMRLFSVSLTDINVIICHFIRNEHIFSWQNWIFCVNKGKTWHFEVYKPDIALIHKSDCVAKWLERSPWISGTLYESDGLSAVGARKLYYLVFFFKMVTSISYHEF